MNKKFLSLLIAAATVVCLTLTGCGMDSNPTLPQLVLDGSELTGTVEYINGRTCRILITEEDGHYDAEDQLYLTYSTIAGSKAIKVGDTVSFSYRYTQDVSEYNGDPHITVNEVSVLE